MGLVRALESLCEGFGLESALRIDLQAAGMAAVMLDPDIQIQAFRCLILPDDAEMAPYKSIDLFWVVKSGANRIVQFCFNATSVHPIQGPLVAFLIGRLAGRDDVIDAKLID
jgi:hypothetical protein